MKNVGNVMVTDDYDRFQTDPRNRKIDPHNLARIVHSMRENFIITIALVIRSGKQLIIRDGQHRLQACKILDKPFYFVVIDDLVVDKIKDTNETLPTLQLSKHWKPIDYVNYYSKQGFHEYKVLQDFIEETGIMPISAVICLTKHHGVSLPKNFRHGGFKIQNLERGYALAAILIKLKTFKFISSTNPRFVSALKLGLDEHIISLEKIMNAIEANPRIRFIGGSVTQTLENLKNYCLKDRRLVKRQIEFKNDWPY